MKSILISILLLIFSISFGQITKLRNTLQIASTTDNAVKVFFEQRDTTLRRYITFLNHDKKDTIFLTMKNKFQSNSCFIEQIQIDNQGMKEVHITWTYTKPFGLGDYVGNETSSSSELKFVHHELWNLDTKELIFSALSYYRLEEYFQMRNTENHTLTYSEYDFTLSETGKIILTNAKKSSNTTLDKAEGVYIYNNGKYTKE